MICGGRVAARRPDLERARLLAQAPRGGGREQVRLPWRRAEPEDRRHPGTVELLVELELLPRDVEEAAEVDVVHARREAAAHHREVEAVGGGVDAHPRPCGC